MIRFWIKHCFGIPQASTYWDGYLWTWLLSERVNLVRTIQCKLCVKHSWYVLTLVLLKTHIHTIPVWLLRQVRWVWSTDGGFTVLGMLFLLVLLFFRSKFKYVYPSFQKKERKKERNWIQMTWSLKTQRNHIEANSKKWFERMCWAGSCIPPAPPPDFSTVSIPLPITQNPAITVSTQ